MANRSGTLGSVAAEHGRDNSINIIRLCLAVSVILWHGIFLGGWTKPPLLEWGGAVGVDGFFVLSGFLISMSWDRSRRAGRFLWHRGLRILPAFWVSLVVVALVGWIFAGSAAWRSHNTPLLYVLKNAFLQIHAWDVAGTPNGVPYPGFWNTPVWTLEYEAQAYLGVLILGVVALLIRPAWRWVPPIVVVLLIGGQIYNWLKGADAGAAELRLFGSFATGVAAYAWRDRIPFRTSFGLTAIALTLVCVFALQDDYRISGMIPFAYALLWTGYRFRGAPIFRHDISYGVYIYGYVVQQVLAYAGLYRAGYPVFVAIAIVLTAMIATGSWFAIERPALRLKDWSPGRRRVASTSDVEQPTTEAV